MPGSLGVKPKPRGYYSHRSVCHLGIINLLLTFIVVNFCFTKLLLFFTEPPLFFLTKLLSLFFSKLLFLLFFFNELLKLLLFFFTDDTYVFVAQSWTPQKHDIVFRIEDHSSRCLPENIEWTFPISFEDLIVMH
jgi:hypothetical protein